jgi:glyoxylase-like metal-dependent hydrolase (beta-lactamase superfamily II)/rhodanese-related sulfurtransferase
MIFEQITVGGCQSYLIGCPDSCAGALIDPEASQVDRYLALASRHGLRIHYVIDTHTHADHFSASRRLAGQLGARTVMYRTSPAPGIDLRLDDGDCLLIGKLRLQVMHTPGHTADSMSLCCEDRVFTGDALLIGGTGRTDLPSGDPVALHHSLFERLLTLPAATLVHPAHEYKGRSHSTIGDEAANNPRLQQRDRVAFVAMMNNLNLSMPAHLTEALRTNMSGGKTVAEMLAEATALVPFMSMAELQLRLAAGAPLVVLDVRERDAFEAGHIPGARLLPRGQLELRVDTELPDPTARIITVCEYGRISTLAAATLRSMGFQKVAALDGGMSGWVKRGLGVVTGPQA